MMIINYYLTINVVWVTFCFRSDDSDDELDDYEISKIVIVTQTPPPPKKYDRTGNFTNRTKMTQELAHMISDGLYYYEQDLLEEDDNYSYVNRKVGLKITIVKDFSAGTTRKIIHCSAGQLSPFKYLFTLLREDCLLLLLVLTPRKTFTNKRKK